MDNKLIGKPILEQIQIQDRMALMAWGAKQFTAIKNGVQFNIRTPKYRKGALVKIKLNSMDTYDIEIVTITKINTPITRVTKLNTKVVDSSKDVYVDMLIETLDSLIEGEKKEVIFF